MSMEPNAEQSIDPIVQITNNYYQESYHAKRNRMFLNADNFNVYHLKQDYTHKKAGQSKEFLGKQYMSVEQITSFLQQGLQDEKNWFEIDLEDGVKEGDVSFTTTEIKHLLEREFKWNNMIEFIPDAIKLALLGSLMIVKIHGGYYNKRKFFVQPDDQDHNVKRLYKADKSSWRLKLSLVRQEDWYPDPTGENLYEMEVIELDWYQLYKMAQDNPGIYDMEKVMDCGTMIQQDQKVKKSRETDQNATFSTYRRRIKIKECWGNVVEQGTGKLLFENVVWAVANDHYLIRPPKPNPFWHGQSPYVTCPIVRVPHSVWHKALMDAPTKHNRALNEIYNLMFDSGMMSAFGIKQVRESWLDDPSEIDDGVFPGQTLKVNTSCPPGMKVLEQVATGGTPQESIEMFNLTDKEFQTSALTSDLRLGVLPSRQVKATEVVASNQTITGMFNGIVKIVESNIEKIVEKSWLTCAQYLNDLDEDEISAVFGPERAHKLASLSPEERFASSALGRKYKVFGMSTVLNKINDFRKITSLLQTIAQSPVLVQEFSKKYDFGKLLTQITESLEIDTDKIKNDNPQQAQQPGGQPPANPQQLAQLALGGGDQMSQIPQASTGSMQSPVQQGLAVQRGPEKMGSTNPQMGG